MDAVRFGRSIRALRIRRRWRQADLAAAAGVSQTMVWRLERGQAGRMRVNDLDAIAQALGARFDLRLDWQGEALDRLLDRHHADLVETVARLLRDAGWVVEPEVTFAIRGERGSIDLLAWHPLTRVVLVIEVKSVVPDVQATLATLDRKTRLAAEIALSRGWRALAIGRLLVVAESRTARRRIAAHATTFDAVLPMRNVALRRYLAHPNAETAVGGLWFLSGSHGVCIRQRARVRARAA